MIAQSSDECLLEGSAQLQKRQVPESSQCKNPVLQNLDTSRRDLHVFFNNPGQIIRI